MIATMITVGCKSTHGGVVITGDPTMTINGKPVARLGDLHSCPQKDNDKPHSIKPIVAGSACIARPQVMGRPIAIAGDKAACGAVLLPCDATSIVQC